MSISAEQLITKNIELVSLPAIVMKINQLLAEPNASAADIAEYIAQDPALTARVLQIVNSALFNFPSKIDSLSMAVTITGTQHLRDIVIANSVINKFNNVDSTALNIETFWCHSITTGLAARTLARQVNFRDAERVFISGLLHDIGKMVMSLLLPIQTRQLSKALQSADVDIDNIEQQVFGFTHSDVAHALLEHWQFPQSISMPILHHHHLDGPKTSQLDTAIVHIANVIANNIQAPVSGDDDTLLNPQALQIVGLDESELGTCYEVVYKLLDDVLNDLYYAIAA